uniref:RluA family pseudouridine synthase n=1 Tax=Agathobacter sp. TaxID=2021311 RepID=UPI004056FA78
MKEFTIQKNEENQRFDKYLKKLLPNAASGFLYKMLRKKNIVLNQKKASGNEKLAAGDTVRIYLSDETFAKFHADLEALRVEYDSLKNLSLNGIKIIYEDADMIAADKPYNMLSQKAAENDLSANEHLLGYMIQKNELSFEQFQTFRPSVVNRLDRNTTGLLLFGKTLEGLQRLSEQIRTHTLQKYYRTIVKGELKNELHLKGYLKKDEKNNKVTFFETETEGADYMETGVKPLKSLGGTTLAEIHLVTGKTHQIRLHLSSIGHPVIGDKKYGDEPCNKMYRHKYGINHQMLHAYRLEFPDGKVIVAELPKAFSKILEER